MKKLSPSDSIDEDDNGGEAPTCNVINWMQLHTEACLENGSLIITPLQLCHLASRKNSCLTSVLDQDGSVDEKGKNNGKELKSKLLDGLLTDVDSPKTFILSFSSFENRDDSSWRTMERLLQKKAETSVSFLVLRRNRSDNNKNENNLSSSLCNQFLSMTLSSDNTNHATDAGENQEKEKEMILLASNFIARMILQFISTGDSDKAILPVSMSQNDEKTGPKTNKTSNSLPRSVISKASRYFTSILASYDLVEDDPYYHNNQDASNEEDFEEDDYASAKNKNDYSLTTYDDDDASAFLKKDDSLKQSSCNNKNAPLLESDPLWNIQLIYQCWKVLLHFGEDSIQKLKRNKSSIEDHHQIATVKVSDCQQGEQTINGLILNRWDDSKSSFLVFCHEAGKVSSSSKDKEDNDKNEFSSMDMGKVLSNLKLGFVLEVLVMTLVSTNQAVLSSDGNVIVLCPNNSQTAALPIVNIEIQTSLVIDEVDLALFNLKSAIQKIECRIETLTEQSEQMKESAINAKRSNNNRAALMYMKRRQMISKEIDQSSASLFNLETGLHSLERARNDAHVLQVYEMMNTAMKSVQSGIGDLSHVDDVMEDFTEGRNTLQSVHDTLGGVTIGDQHITDKELEMELMSLQENTGSSNDTTRPPSSYEKDENKRVGIDEVNAPLSPQVDVNKQAEEQSDIRRQVEVEVPLSTKANEDTQTAEQSNDGIKQLSLS